MNSIEVDVFAIVLLLFTLVMIKRNIKFYHHNGNYFFMSCVVTIIVVLLEIIDNYIDQSEYFENILWIRYAINITGFGICPLIIYYLVLFYDNTLNLQTKLLLAIPTIINYVITFLSIWFGFVFTIKDGTYERGSIFLFTSIVCLFYIIFLLYLNFKNKRRFARRESIILIWTIIIAISSSTIQMLFGEIHTIWPAVSIGLFVYYVSIRDMQFEYDIMTELKNRASYEKDLVEMRKKSQVTIIVFDINNLKKINDVYGHSYGDDAICEVAKALLNNFDSLGVSYRIGGDEFVTLCNNVDEGIINHAIDSFTSNINDISKTKKYTLLVPYGISNYTNNSDDIVDEIKKADKKMYQNKKISKELIK